MIYLILILGFVLRLISINQSLWLDEAIGALVVQDLSYRELFTSFLAVDNHPPLYYLLLKFWTGIFGYSEISLRMPSVLFGVGTIYLAFVITRKIKILNTNFIPLLVAIFLATSQFHIYYSQEARMYSMTAFFVSLSIYLYMKLDSEKLNLWYWLLFSLSNLVAVFTDYMSIFVLPVFFIYAFYVKHNKFWWIKLFLSFIPLAIAWIVWLPYFQKQSTGGAWLMQILPEWKKLAGGADLKQIVLVWIKFTSGRISFIDKQLYYLYALIASIPFMVLILASLRTFKKYIFILSWILIPLLLSFTVSFYIPAFSYFRLIYLLPPFYILLVFGVGNVRIIRIKNVLIGFVIVVNIFSLAVYYLSYYQKRENWKEAVMFVEKNIDENEIVLFSYPDPFAPYRWYENKPELSYGATDSIKANASKTTEKTKTLISDKKSIYYFEYLKDLSDPQSIVIKNILEEGFTEKKIYGNYQGVGLIYYFSK